MYWALVEFSNLARHCARVRLAVNVRLVCLVIHDMLNRRASLGEEYRLVSARALVLALSVAFKDPVLTCLWIFRFTKLDGPQSRLHTCLAATILFYCLLSTLGGG